MGMMCRQCNERYSQERGLCRRCQRALGDVRTNQDRDRERIERAARRRRRASPLVESPEPTREVVTIGTTEYEVVWNGSASVPFETREHAVDTRRLWPELVAEELERKERR